MPRFLLLFLTLIALFNLSRVLREPSPTADRPMDFRTCYVGQSVLRQGLNPYHDATLKQGWQRIVRAEAISSRTQPGLPNLPFLYPPWAAALFGLTIGRLPYSLAWPVWSGLALLGLGLVSWLWAWLLRAALAPSIPWWHYLVAALALKGTVPALLVGQPTFLALALGVGALAVSQIPQPRLRSHSYTGWAIGAEELALQHNSVESWRPLLAGLLLGLAAFKVTLVLPFAAWFLWKKQWLALAVAAATVALLSAVAWSWATAPGELLPAYQQLLAQVRAQSFDPADPDYPLTQGMTLRLEASNVLEWLRPSSWPWHLRLNLTLWVAGLIRLWRAWQGGVRVADWHLFLIISLLTLLTTYHLYYDAVLLLPLLAFRPQLTRRKQWLLLALLLPLLLPLNGIAQALGNPAELRFVYFLMPVSLFGVLVLVLPKFSEPPPAPLPAGETNG